MRNKHSILCICLVMLASICSSCLEEIENVYDAGMTTAVVRIHGDSAKMMANTRFGWVYDKKLASYSDGKCLLMRFYIDPNLEENKKAEKRGYYTVEIRGDQKVNQQDARAEKTDMGVLFPNEQSVPYAVNPNDQLFYNYLENYLFLPSVCVATPSQSLDWKLTYDPDQRPLIEDGKTIYTLFLHAVGLAPTTPEDEVKPLATINAFNLSTFIRDMRNRGGRESDMYVQIYHVEQINPQDSTQFVWNQTEPFLLKQ